MTHLLALLACTSVGPDTGLDTDPPSCEGREPAEAQALPALPAWTSSERSYATGLGWGDVDGDGHLDLIVASGNDVNPGPVSVHLGRVDGTLSRAPDRQTTTWGFHGHLAVGDLDGDGFDDVVVARYLGDGGFEDPGGVDVYRGGPDGLSDTPTQRLEGFSSFAVALGDRDVDGDLDLAVATGEVYEGLAWTDRVYDNDGGLFAATPAWESDEATIALAVRWVDADADGALDLAFARSGAPHARYDGPALALGWEAPGQGFDGNGMDFGDVDGDGLPDLLVSDNTAADGPGTVRLFCGADWETCWEHPERGEPFSAVSLVDVDGDGDLETVVGRWWGPVEVFDGEARWQTATSTVVEAFAWHDLDGAHEVPGCVEGEGLVALPRGARVVAVDPPDAAIGDGYVSAAGPLSVRYRISRQPDLAVSNWDPEVGSYVFTR